MTYEMSLLEREQQGLLRGRAEGMTKSTEDKSPFSSSTDRSFRIVTSETWSKSANSSTATRRLLPRSC